METRERFLEALEEVYRLLDGSLPPPYGNPCGECRQCCTARGLTRHPVSDLELDLLAARVGPEGARDFEDYAARRPGPGGEPLHADCPFYEAGGCSVYPWRPFACRAFGHYRVAGTRFPEGCTFLGKETEFPFERYFATVPGSRDLHRLKRDYAFVRRPGPVRLVAPGGAGRLGDDDLAYLDPDDPLDRSTRALVGGDLEGALAEARRALAEIGGTPSVLYALGTSFEMLGRHREALVVFEEGARLLPECADFHYHRGYNQVQLRDFQAGSAALSRAVDLNPEHSLALGFLGYVLLLDRRFAEAVPWLERAVAVDPDNGFFRARLEQARAGQA